MLNVSGIFSGRNMERRKVRKYEPVLTADAMHTVEHQAEICEGMTRAWFENRYTVKKDALLTETMLIAISDAVAKHPPCLCVLPERR